MLWEGARWLQFLPMGKLSNKCTVNDVINTLGLLDALHILEAMAIESHVYT